MVLSRSGDLVHLQVLNLLCSEKRMIANVKPWKLIRPGIETPKYPIETLALTDWVCDAKNEPGVFPIPSRLGRRVTYFDKCRLLYRLDYASEWHKVWLLPTGFN